MMSADPPAQQSTTSRRVGILAAVCVAVLAINLDVTIVNVALPSIATQLHADTRGLQWAVDGYAEYDRIEYGGLPVNVAVSSDQSSRPGPAARWPSCAISLHTAANAGL